MTRNPLLITTLLSTVVGLAQAQNEKLPAYPAMAPIEQYRMASVDEIALARSAAPPAISSEAGVLILGEHGYESVAKSKNGFVCFVERSWTAGFDDREFWNPALRGPNCFNPAAVRSVLPYYLERTKWVLQGLSKQQMVEKTRAGLASRKFVMPQAGAFSFMLSKQGFLSDQANGPWLPHVMLFVPHGQAADWAAGLEGSPILGEESSQIEPSVLFIPVRRWSDGSAAPPVTEPHTHG